MASSFPALIADELRTEQFRLLDIGCSGGLDPLWRAFEPRLQALGIDASATECQRLAGLERNPDVAYVAAFAARSADKPIDISAGPAAPLIMQMRDRLSFMRTREIRDARLEAGLDRGAAAPQCLGDDRAGRPGQAGRRARASGRARLDAISTISRSTSTARTSRSCRSFDGRFDPLA